ncbi:MAG TPA: glycosyltransferase family 2 protein [Anaerolineaceae bacterium]|nr:glycosyltransferase family 2 protein [Anaerolineaceae bacterium]
MPTLSVVIPAYNEERGIEAIVQRVMAIKDDLALVGVQELELLVVNDGSKDHTADVLRDIAPRYEGMRILLHERNKGYGAALKTGFSCARGELVGFLDADGTYPPEYFPQLCLPALAGAELVIGSRMAGAKSEMPITRRIGNFLFANLLSLVGWEKVTDSASGMRVFQKSVLERLYPLPNGLNLTPVMSTRAVHEGVKMVEVPIPYSERVGRSKLSVVRDGYTFLQSILWTVLSYNPVRILGIVGLAGVALALLVALGMTIARLSGVTELSPWAVFALFSALVAGVVGVSLFALGATFNYLVTLLYKRPIRQGLFGKPIFKTPLDRQFGWMGLIGVALGLVVAVVSLVLGINGWAIERLWFYLLASAMALLVGVQLMIYWILMRVLEELSQREGLARNDLQAI